jgi:hypothetical protein
MQMDWQSIIAIITGVVLGPLVTEWAKCHPLANAKLGAVINLGILLCIYGAGWIIAPKFNLHVHLTQPLPETIDVWISWAVAASGLSAPMVNAWRQSTFRAPE